MERVIPFWSIGLGLLGPVLRFGRPGFRDHKKGFYCLVKTVGANAPVDLVERTLWMEVRWRVKASEQDRAKTDDLAPGEGRRRVMWLR
jgi:hypothetical protein